MTMASLLILGCGGHGVVVSEAASSLYSDVQFLDDSSDNPISKAFVSDKMTSISHAIVAIGDPTIRLRLTQKLLSFGYKVPIIIHPTAWVSPSAQLAPGTVVMAHAVVQTRTRIGMAAIVNTSSSVDHDSVLGPGVHVSPGSHIAGNVTVGRNSWVGIGSSIIQGVNIGADVFIAAGAVVISDIPDGVLAKGVPATFSQNSPRHP